MVAKSFDECMREGRPYTADLGAKGQNKGFYSASRVDKDTLPTGWFAYDTRSANGDATPYTVEKNSVSVNFAGTLLTKTRIPFPSVDGRQRDYIMLTRSKNGKKKKGK